MFRRKDKASVSERDRRVQNVHDHVCHEEAIKFTAPASHTSGSSPTGTLEITLRSKELCPGFESGTSVIALDYTIPDGIQRACHPNPGAKYEGDTRTSFLPNNEQGRELLTRFKCAWLYGHMLSVGRSQTHRRDNMTLWSSVPQKSNLNGGPFGFPDPQYIHNAHHALDKLGIPDAVVCLALMPLVRNAQYETAKCLDNESNRHGAEAPKCDTPPSVSSSKKAPLLSESHRDVIPYPCPQATPSLAPAVPIFCPCDTSIMGLKPLAPPSSLSPNAPETNGAFSGFSDESKLSNVVHPSSSPRSSRDPLLGAALFKTESVSLDSTCFPVRDPAFAATATINKKTEDPLSGALQTPMRAQNCDKDGNTPLHLALLHKVPFSTVNAMAKLYPEATLVVNKKGQTPLDIALLDGLCMETICGLIQARDEAIGRTG